PHGAHRRRRHRGPRRLRGDRRGGPDPPLRDPGGSAAEPPAVPRARLPGRRDALAPPSPPPPPTTDAGAPRRGGAGVLRCGRGGTQNTLRVTVEPFSSCPPASADCS